MGPIRIIYGAVSIYIKLNKVEKKYIVFSLKIVVKYAVTVMQSLLMQVVQSGFHLL
jgi:hypothetical protein